MTMCFWAPTTGKAARILGLMRGLFLFRNLNAKSACLCSEHSPVLMLSTTSDSTFSFRHLLCLKYIFLSPSKHLVLMTVRSFLSVAMLRWGLWVSLLYHFPPVKPWMPLGFSVFPGFLAHGIQAHIDIVSGVVEIIQIYEPC